MASCLRRAPCAPRNWSTTSASRIQQPSGTDPFSITTELAECPWNPKHRLALIGLQGRAATDRDPAPRNLVFLLDVSGSMMPADKLPLVRKAMRMLTDVLTERDSRRDRRLRRGQWSRSAVHGLATRRSASWKRSSVSRPGGSTNGAEGIQLAYQVARRNFIRGGVNRVVLATDGDFNVGVTNESDLVRAHRTRTRERHLPVGSLASAPEPQGLDHGEAGRQGQRQLLVSRFGV
jgi:Ca-activated chloride channel family protein